MGIQVKFAYQRKEDIGLHLILGQKVPMTYALHLTLGPDADL